MEAFAKFEHEGWQRVAGKYDSVWASSTRQFIPPLLDAAEVTGNMLCSRRWLWPRLCRGRGGRTGRNIARPRFFQGNGRNRTKKFPHIEFREGDAQNLPFTDATFDRVLANFALLHLPDPERACAEAYPCP